MPATVTSPLNWRRPRAVSGMMFGSGDSRQPGPLPLQCASAAVLLPTAHSQTVTGSITGTVVARTNSVVAGAIQPPDEIAKQQREFTSSNGAFTFVDLASGQEGIKLHSIRLEAGDVNSSVEVSAELVHGTTDRSDDFPLVQIQETPVSGRAFPATIKGTLPVGGSLRMQTTGNGRRCECSRGEIPLAL